MSDITNILAVETTGGVCSVALVTPDEVFEDTRYVARMHNQLLLAMIDDLFNKWGATLSQLDAVAFGAGPGSFTGVRIGAATCQAIALAADVGVAPISSSLALATSVLNQETTNQTHSPLEGIITLIASVPGAAYLGAFLVSNSELQETGEQTLVKQRPTLSSGLPPEVNERWRIVGAEWSSLGKKGFGEKGLEKKEFEKESEEKGSEQPPCAYSPAKVNAVVIAELGLKAWASGALVSPELALPIYVRGDHPWK